VISDDSQPPPESDGPTPDQQQEPEPTPEPEPSPAVTRFKACRWHAADEEQEYCSNRDVLPYAGKLAFTPEAWCPDCALYKLRRTPKKRPRPEDDDYGY
jgi:hypothetical protein